LRWKLIWNVKSIYKKAALEIIARRILTEFNSKLLHGPASAVPIEKLARWLGLRIEYQCLRKNGLILGEMVYDTGYVPVYHQKKSAMI